MILNYVERGVAAGAIAGVAYGVYIATVANPFITHLENLAHHGHDHGHAVTEFTTAVVSVGSGLLWGILLGGMFGAMFYFLEPSLPGRSTAKAYILAGAGFLTLSVTPWLVLPPAVPGAELTLSTEIRLVIYAGLMCLGALVATASVLGYRSTISRGQIPAIAIGLVPIGIVAIVLPTVTPTIVSAGELAPELVITFQWLVVLSQAALWVIIAGSYSWLHARADGGAESTGMEHTMYDPT